MSDDLEQQVAEGIARRMQQAHTPMERKRCQEIARVIIEEMQREPK